MPTNSAVMLGQIHSVRVGMPPHPDPRHWPRRAPSPPSHPQWRRPPGRRRRPAPGRWGTCGDGQAKGHGRVDVVASDVPEGVDGGDHDGAEGEEIIPRSAIVNGVSPLTIKVAGTIHPDEHEEMPFRWLQHRSAGADWSRQACPLLFLTPSDEIGTLNVIGRYATLHWDVQLSRNRSHRGRGSILIELIDRQSGSSCASGHPTDEPVGTGGPPRPRAVDHARHRPQPRRARTAVQDAAPAATSSDPPSSGSATSTSTPSSRGLARHPRAEDLAPHRARGYGQAYS